MKCLASVFIVCAMVILPGFPKTIHAASSCSLCILELQAQGAGDEEDQDFVVIANVSGTTIPASSSSPIRLQYYNSQGVASSSAVVSTSTIPKDQVYVFTSDTLGTINGNTLALSMPLYSGGGSLQLQRGTTIYDKVGWGSAINVEGVSAPVPSGGTTLARKHIDIAIQDTNNNSQDFYLHELGCQGQEISEIQPFAADAIGQSIDAWVEVISSAESASTCSLITKVGDIYTIADDDLVAGSRNVVSRGVALEGQIMPMHLGEVSGQIWLVAASEYAHVRLPISTRAYSNLENGQSFALVDDIWRRTYTPTPGGENIYTSSGVVQDDPMACSTVRISEVFPNPMGEDTGHEWVEIINESDQPTQLQDCIISIGGTEYRFLPDDILGAREWRAIDELYDEEQKPQTLSLRNSGSTLVSLQRDRADGLAETLQSFEYTDAPEGQAWARFANGWRWVIPTPNADNTTLPPANNQNNPTEFPADPNHGPAPEQQASALVGSVSITELLPNPAAPATDDTDEFIELFNAADEPVSLRGYKLQTGNSYNYSFTFTDQIIPPKSYIEIMSGESSVSLANSGGRARLVNTEGEVIYETVPYVDAMEGQAWALIEGVWKWTALPTPGTTNTFKAPVLTALSKSKASAAPKATGTVKSATKTSTSATKAPKTSPTAATKSDNSIAQQATIIPQLHPMILAVVGGLGVLYAAYEYRQDIANKIYQFRRDRKNRRANRTSLEGR